MKHNPGFLALVNDAKSRVKQIDIDQYKKMSADNHVLIDTREDNEWADGHAEGAVHLSKGIIERDIEHEIPDKSTTLVLYCGGGFRSDRRRRLRGRVLRCCTGILRRPAGNVSTCQ